MTEGVCPVAYGAASYGSRIAIVSPRGTVTYEELERRVAVAAARLREAGCAEGMRVGLHLPTGEAYIVLLLALLRIRCVACPVSTRLPEQGIAAALDLIACRVLISDDVRLHGCLEGVRILSPEAVVNGEPGAGYSSAGLDFDQPATIISTSGSTGRPKAALHTWGNHYFNALGSNANIPLEPGHRWLLSLPLYHVGGLGIVSRCLLAGATIAIPVRGEAFTQSIASLGITHVSMVTTQLMRLLREGQTDQLTGLSAILLGGSAFSPALLEDAYAMGLPIHTSYGLTEMTSQVTTTPPGADLDALRTSGSCLPYRELRISEDGEILVRGRTRFLGYVEREHLHQPFDAEGWYHTGDLGTLDERGNLVVSGRQDNMFISGGENIQPEEIEWHLGQLTGVEQAVVVPVPDAEFGFRPVAFIRSYNAGEEIDYRAALESVLPRFKVPYAIFPLEDEQAGERMKVDRRALAARAATLTGRA